MDSILLMYTLTRYSVNFYLLLDYIIGQRRRWFFKRFPPPLKEVHEAQKHLHSLNIDKQSDFGLLCEKNDSELWPIIGISLTSVCVFPIVPPRADRRISAINRALISLLEHVTFVRLSFEYII